jgi:uncharacterized protein YndB with AHSA1/START domain
MVQVASSGTAVVTLPADTQILITREFDAPKHLVYRAFTEPELVERWWSGERGTMTGVEADVRPGGRWRYEMKDDEGTEIAFRGEYREVVPNERLVSTEVYELGPGAVNDDAQGTLNTTTFTEADGRTTLTTLTECPSQEVRDAIIASGMEGGMQEAMDKLERVAISLG